MGIECAFVQCPHTVAIDGFHPRDVGDVVGLGSEVTIQKEKEYQAKNIVTYQNHGLGFLLHKPYMKKYLKRAKMLIKKS